ncbi:MAG: hypothetical protein L0H15_08540 [Nitrosospira sp.]|nr:hypothetical protein [Nitrosospira sp.]
MFFATVFALETSLPGAQLLFLGREKKKRKWVTPFCYSFCSSVNAGHFANATTHRSTRIPPGISASNENAGLKPARPKIRQNGTTKNIADAISQGSIPNSPM